MVEKLIYLDNAATTKVSETVLKAMLPFFTEQYGNPSSIYKIATYAKTAVEESRKKVALALNCLENEVYFTASGTEADNWAIKGAARFQKQRYGKNHIITSVFEHHAVLHSVEHLQKEGFEITYIPVDSYGFINPNDIHDALTDKTALVSIMYANNEIGTIQPIREIGTICKAAGVIFHTDAVQAVGNIKIDVKADNIDMLSLSGHKLNSPKGIGALYIRKGIMLDTLIDGGAQEKGRRAGTENVPYIVGLGFAIEEATKDIDTKSEYLTDIRNYYLDRILKTESVRLNGSRENRLPGNANISVEGIEGESLLLLLNAAGIMASSGSACTSGSLDPSHVLLAIGLPHEIAHGSLRTTFSTETTKEDIDYLLLKLEEIIVRLRAMSPIWNK